jgi:hypothetical protein
VKLPRVNDGMRRVIGSAKLILCETDSTECRRSRTRIVRNMILMLQRVNSNIMKIIKITILMLHSVKIARQGLAGLGY